MAPRKTAAQKAAEEKLAAEQAVVEAPVEAPVEEAPVEEAPSIDEVINEGEPIVEIVTDDEDAEPAAEPEPEPAVPATVALEAPAAKADPDGLTVPRPVGSNAQVTSEFQSAPAVTLRREYVDAATRQRVDPTAIFDRASKIGGSYTCTVRLVERLHFSDRDAPEGRLVLAKGAQTNAANVEHLIDHITAAHAEWEPEQG